MYIVYVDVYVVDLPHMYFNRMRRSLRMRPSALMVDTFLEYFSLVKEHSCLYTYISTSL